MVTNFATIKGHKLLSLPLELLDRSGLLPLERSDDIKIFVSKTTTKRTPYPHELDRLQNPLAHLQLANPKPTRDR